MQCTLCGGASIVALGPWSDGRKYLKCGICDLVWMHPESRVGKDSERGRYLEHNNSVDDKRYLKYLARLADPVVALIAPGAHGIDFGCGPVEGMRALLEPMGYFVSSYDPFFFPDDRLLKNHYDFVLCSEVVEHFFEPRAELERMGALLKRGGVLGIRSLLLPDDKPFETWWYRIDRTHVTFFSARTVEWIAAHFGWELVKLDDPIWIFRT